MVRGLVVVVIDIRLQCPSVFVKHNRLNNLDYCASDKHEASCYSSPANLYVVVPMITGFEDGLYSLTFYVPRAVLLFAPNRYLYRRLCEA